MDSLNSFSGSLEVRCTTIYIDIRFRKEDKYYHLLKFEIYPEDSNDDHAGYEVSAGYLTIGVDKILENNSEIAAAVVDYLSTLKLYLHSYRIFNNRTYVAYARKTPRYSDNLAYSPIRHELNFFIAADVQLEDDVDYDKELGILFHKPISAITDGELNKLGLRMRESGIRLMAVLGEDEMPSHLRI